MTKQNGSIEHLHLTSSEIKIALQMNLDREDRELVKLIIEQSIRSRKKRAQFLIKMMEKRESTN